MAGDDQRPNSGQGDQNNQYRGPYQGNSGDPTQQHFQNHPDNEITVPNIFGGANLDEDPDRILPSLNAGAAGGSGGAQQPNPDETIALGSAAMGYGQQPGAPTGYQHGDQYQPQYQGDPTGRGGPLGPYSDPYTGHHSAQAAAGGTSMLAATADGPPENPDSRRRRNALLGVLGVVVLTVAVVVAAIVIAPRWSSNENADPDPTVPIGTESSAPVSQSAPQESSPVESPATVEQSASSPAESADTTSGEVSEPAPPATVTVTQTDSAAAEQSAAEKSAAEKSAADKKAADKKAADKKAADKKAADKKAADKKAADKKAADQKAADQKAADKAAAEKKAAEEAAAKKAAEEKAAAEKKAAEEAAKKKAEEEARNLGVPRKNIECSDGYVVQLASELDEAAFKARIADLKAKGMVPLDAKAADSTQSCNLFSSQSNTWVLYVGPYSTPYRGCAARLAGPADAFIKGGNESNAHDYISCLCPADPAALPKLQTGVDQPGWTGELQRVLGNRLNISVGPLGPDQWGTYTDGTRDAVKKFQKENKLPDNGVVDAKTWAKLRSAQGC